MLEVEMECVLESEDEIKFENEMAFHPNTDSRIARWLLPRYMYEVCKERSSMPTARQNSELTCIESRSALTWLKT